MHPQPFDYTLRIAHLADPQLGFGPGGFDDDLAAFTTEIKNVNSLRPDLVVIAGDMVNRMDSTSVARFKEAAATIEAPVVYTPGNHDISEPCSPREAAHSYLSPPCSSAEPPPMKGRMSPPHCAAPSTRHTAKAPP